MSWMLAIAHSISAPVLIVITATWIAVGEVGRSDSAWAGVSRMRECGAGELACVHLAKVL
jgi:hypothetical protein